MSWINHTMGPRVTIGPGDFSPPDDSADYYRDTTERIERFAGYVVRNGVVYVQETRVTVDSETHEVIKYGRRVERRVDFFRGAKAGPRFLAYCRKHPRKGPQLLAIAVAAGVEVSDGR